MATKNYFWRNRTSRKHERLATELIRVLATREACLSLQTAIVGEEIRVDITMDGAHVGHMLPPFLVKKVEDYDLLIELESGTLGAFKFRRMYTALMNAHVRYVRMKRSSASINGPKHEKAPMLIVYARRIGTPLMRTLEPTREKGIYHYAPNGVHVYLIDNTRTPSDSEHNHLGLLYAPKAATKEEFEAKVLEQYRQVIQYSRIPIRELEGIVMTSTHQLFTDIEKREEIRTMSLGQALDQGRREGLREGKREGLREGKREGLREGKQQEASVYRRGIQELANIRGVTLTADSLERLRACDDSEQLVQWNLQVATAEGPIVELDD